MQHYKATTERLQVDIGSPSCHLTFLLDLVIMYPSVVQCHSKVKKTLRVLQDTFSIPA